MPRPKKPPGDISPPAARARTHPHGAVVGGGGELEVAGRKGQLAHRLAVRGQALDQLQVGLPVPHLPIGCSMSQTEALNQSAAWLFTSSRLVFQWRTCGTGGGHSGPCVREHARPQAAAGGTGGRRRHRHAAPTLTPARPLPCTHPTHRAAVVARHQEVAVVGEGHGAGGGLVRLRPRQRWGAEGGACGHRGEGRGTGGEPPTQPCAAGCSATECTDWVAGPANPPG